MAMPAENQSTLPVPTIPGKSLLQDSFSLSLCSLCDVFIHALTPNYRPNIFSECQLRNLQDQKAKECS